MDHQSSIGRIVVPVSRETHHECKRVVFLESFDAEFRIKDFVVMRSKPNVTLPETLERYTIAVNASRPVRNQHKIDAI